MFAADDRPPDDDPREHPVGRVTSGQRCLACAAS
jgi:hypothetical protein